MTQAGSLGVSDQGRSIESQGDRHREEIAESLGLEERYGSLWSKTFYLLTDQQLVLGTRSAMRDRPHELLHAAPLAGVRVHWFDHDAGFGNRFRHYITIFGDGTCRGDRGPLTQLGRTSGSSNADPFIAALGSRAAETAGP